MALKVFLVDDESVIREGLRDNIPWQQYGYRFIGEAGDGEMALPLIRRERPDVIITDIKMPFMDGLSLCHIVKQELPDTKIIIMSGYDDFEYARQAIKEGVEQYLLKPITRSALAKALAEVKEKIDSEMEQKNYLKKYQDEMQEYEQSFRRNFFEKVFEGLTPLSELYEEAAKYDLDINAPAYNIVLTSVKEKQGKSDAVETCQECQEEIMRFFLRFPDQTLGFRWGIDIYGILIKGDGDNIDSRTENCIENIRNICSKYEAVLEWHTAAGESVERFSLLGECYSKANHIFSYRFFAPDEHVLTEGMISKETDKSSALQIEKIDTDLVNPELIKGFLNSGQKDEISEFASNLVAGLSDALNSRLFWDYLLLNIRFTVISFAESLGGDLGSAAQDEISMDNIRHMEMTPDNMKMYVESMLNVGIDYRDKEKNSQGRKALKKAIDYIEENYSDENLSLNEVADVTQISPNYFSAMFSQEMGKTFVEYVTEKRMEKAKELLLTEGIKSGDVGPMVGYKNPQYFSFVFKKTQGCSPREYRSANS